MSVSWLNEGRRIAQPQRRWRFRSALQVLRYHARPEINNICFSSFRNKFMGLSLLEGWTCQTDSSATTVPVLSQRQAFAYLFSICGNGRGETENDDPTCTVTITFRNNSRIIYFSDRPHDEMMDSRSIACLVGQSQYTRDVRHFYCQCESRKHSGVIQVQTLMAHSSKARQRADEAQGLASRRNFP